MAPARAPPFSWSSPQPPQASIFQHEYDRSILKAQSFVYVDDFMAMGATHAAGVQIALAVLDEVGAEFGLERKRGATRRCNSLSS
jgi:hypothetical protein